MPTRALPATHPSPTGLAAALALLRERGPLVQCLTNVVAAQRTADVLLAVGANPAMVDNRREAGPFAALADGVLVNLGMLREETAAAMVEAVAGAAAARTPWVLDPVGVGALAWRTGVAADLVSAHAPTVVRGNASEVLVLARTTDAATGGRTDDSPRGATPPDDSPEDDSPQDVGGSGTRSRHTPEAVLPAARDLARRLGAVVAVSGAVDHVTDGDRVVRVTNGTPLLTQVTGAGCALGALTAAFCAVVDDPLVGAVAATATLTVAADRAATVGRGPGSFADALLDELAALTPEALADRVRLS